MPAIATYDKLIDVVRRSGLVDEARFGTFLENYQSTGGEEEPTPLATRLVREGLITTFQAKQLLQGRWRRFIINNKYKVLDLLGQGGMGAVYLCEHTMMRRLVALKVLPEEKLAQPGALERFQREARAVATLDHPNIVHAYDMDRDDNNMHFMVMEYVDGWSLEIIISKLYKGQGIDPLRAAHYIAQSALGLQHAHECNWVHRDIKPANLLLDRQGIIKILDLGLSRLYTGDEEELTKKYDGGSVLGTADYIAPEQALNVSGVDIRADIYGLGATFYFLLAGRPPFEKGTVTQKLMYHQTREPESITSLRPDVPADLEAVIRTMLAKNPDQRYSHPAAVVEALAPWTQMPIPPPMERELPNHCPLIRNLLPTASSSRSSGSWSLKSLQSSLSTPPLMRLPPVLPGGTSSSQMRAPGQPASGRMTETVVDHAAKQAVTPKSLPKLSRSASGPALRKAASSGTSAADKQIYRYIAYAAIGFAVLIVVIIVYIFWSVLRGDGTDSQATRPRPQPRFDSAAVDRGDSAPAAVPATRPAATKRASDPPPTQPVPRPADSKPTITPEQAREYLDQEVTLEMKVLSTGGTATRSFLNSLENHRDDTNFAVVMLKDVAKAFLARNQLDDIEALKGRTLRLRGRITEFQGKPQMVIDKADQINLLQ